MVDLIANASTWLAGRLKSHAAQQVTYYRGALAVPVLATIGTSEFETEGADGVLTITETRDFLVNVADLIDGAGDTFEPSRGDTVTQVIGDTTHTFTVVERPGLPPFSFFDRYRIRYRIHTLHTDQI